MRSLISPYPVPNSLTGARGILIPDQNISGSTISDLGIGDD